MELHQIDPNFALPEVQTQGIVFHDVRKSEVDIYGLYRPYEQPFFSRMPVELAESIRPGVALLNRHTAGGRIRFTTDSQRIVLRVFQDGRKKPGTKMTFLNTAGFDLYQYQSGSQRYWASFMPPEDRITSYEAAYTVPTRETRDLVLNMPTYDGVEELYIGLEEGAVLTHGSRYRLDKPVVFYGSSITQGGCASRPGNIYQNFLSRMLDIDYVNLGFSGNAKGEIPIAEYMASMDAAAYVVDYDHNAPTADFLEETHEPFVRAIREGDPETPILLMSRTAIPRGPALEVSYQRRRETIQRTCEKLRAEGDKNIYFLNGQDVYQIHGGDSCTVDGAHPNDLGFACMADAICPFLQKMLFGEA